MDERYKSLATLKPDAWVKHFRDTVGKPSTWDDQSRLVLIKHSKGDGGTKTASADLPLNVVSPVEQYTNMAQAEIDKKTPVYKPRSVSTSSSKKDHRGKKRKAPVTSVKGNTNKNKTPKRRIVTKDILSN